VALIEYDGNFSLLIDKINFIRSYIVFQHIPAKIGECLLKNIVGHLKNGDVWVIYCRYAHVSKGFENYSEYSPQEGALGIILFFNKPKMKTWGPPGHMLWQK